MEEIKIKRIGIAKNNVKENRFGNFASEVSEILIDNKYEKGLKGLEDYSHLIVIYWMNEAEGIVHLEHRPQGNPEVPIVGIFATRCQWRPNCIGITTVPLLSIKDNIIKVRGLDILNGTPILDIKPYLPDYDKPEGKIKIASWNKKLTYK